MFFKTKEANLKKIIKEGDLVNLKSIIKNNDASLIITDVTETGMTLLHLAVKYNQLEIIKFLINIKGININAEDSSETTPMLLAVREKHFEAAKLLLNAKARIKINANRETLFTYIFQGDLSSKYIVPEHILQIFREKFIAVINSKQTPEFATVKLLHSIPLKSALALKLPNEILAKAFINRIISPSECRAVVIEAIYNPCYLDNLIVVVFIGLDYEKRYEIFERELRLLIEGSYPNLKLALTLIKQLIKRNFTTNRLIFYFRKLFGKGNVNQIKMLLESGLVEYVKGLRNGEDLTPNLFANKNKIVMQVLEDRDFDVNIKGRYEQCPLNFAVRANSMKNTLYLLDKGADINSKDYMGRTPLFEKFISSKLMKLLISRGADLQVVSTLRYAAFNCDPIFAAKQQHILGHLAILEGQGLPISQDMQDIIQTNEKYKKRFDKYRSYIDRMKKHVVCNSVTLFTILSENPKDIERYVRNNRKTLKKDVRNLRLEAEFLFNNLYYGVRFEKNVKLLLDISKKKNRAIKIVANSIRLFAADHLIVHKIVEFLTYKDLCVIFK